MRFITCLLLLFSSGFVCANEDKLQAFFVPESEESQALRAATGARESLSKSGIKDLDDIDDELLKQIYTEAQEKIVSFIADHSPEDKEIFHAVFQSKNVKITLREVVAAAILLSDQKYKSYHADLFNILQRNIVVLEMYLEQYIKSLGVEERQKANAYFQNNLYPFYFDVEGENLGLLPLYIETLKSMLASNRNRLLTTFAIWGVGTVNLLAFITAAMDYPIDRALLIGIPSALVIGGLATARKSKKIATPKARLKAALDGHTTAFYNFCEESLIPKDLPLKD